MTASKARAQPSSERPVLFYSLLLALQYGAQPLISKRFVRKEVIVTSSVMACELAKVLCAFMIIAKDGSWKRIFKEWTFVGALTASGLPAAIYALQNSLLQISYKNLDSLTFSILNQTKLLFTAFFTYVLLRQKQSVQQIGALCLLIIAAVLLSVGEGTSKGSSNSNTDDTLFYGIIPVLVASVLSGLASSLCQWASQVKKHSSYLMTIEMSVVGCLCLLASTYKSPDGEMIKRHGFFYGWTPLTWLKDGRLHTRNSGPVRLVSRGPCYSKCCWWHSSWPSYIVCWRRSKGICHCISSPGDSLATTHIRWQATFSVLSSCSSTRGHEHLNIPKVPLPLQEERRVKY